MSLSEAHQRKTAHAPYDALTPDASPSPNGRARPHAAEPLVAAKLEFLVAESEKLEALKRALWAAFQENPPASLPPALIDLVTAYTSALRLQITLLAQAPRSMLPGAKSANVAPLPQNKP